MRDEDKTREELVDELVRLRQYVDKLETKSEGQIFMEDPLRAFQRELQIVVDSTYDWEYWLSPDRVFVHNSPSCARICGYSTAEFERNPGLLSQIVHPDDSHHYQDHLNQEHFTSGPCELEFRIIHRNGTVRWMGHVCQPVFDETGTFIGRRGNNRDITQRKRIEEALRESEEHFRLSFDQSPIGAVLTNSDYRLKRVNQKFCQMLGYSEEELLSLRFTDITYHDDLETNLALQQKLATGEIDHYQMEKRCIRRDGSIIWVSISVRMVRNAEGNPIHYMVMAADITARKRMEQALQNSEIDLNRAQFVAQTGSWRLDVLRDELIWSDETYRIFGVRKGTPLTYESFLTHVHPEDRNYVNRKWSDALLGEKYDIEHRIVVSDEIKWVRERAELEFDENGTLQGGFGTVQDITERRRMEEELCKARDELELRVRERTAELELANEKLRLGPSMLIQAQENERQRLAVDLHDSIGQTLAALKFRIEHVITVLGKRESKQALNLLYELVPILQRSIEETRAIYMGLKPMMLSEHGILATLEWCRQELLRLYPNQHIELEAAIREEDIPEDLKTAIFRIAQEALNNTFKHAKSEWVDVRLVSNDGAIELEISDDGIGMDLNYIMESRTAKSLGLIGMRERAELTGGAFTIRSIPNEGTTVSVVWRNHSEIPCLR